MQCFTAALLRKYKKHILIFLITVTIYLYFFHFQPKHYLYLSKRAIHSTLYRRVIPDVLKKGRPYCPYVHVLFSRKTITPMDVPNNYSSSEFDVSGIANGSHAPAHCNPRFSVALLVTYRDRRKQLDIFLPFMHNFLRKQNLHYKIYIIEQTDDELFNKGLLYNIGARAAIADRFPCLLLHDVDLLPLTAANLYACTLRPRHLSAHIDKFNYTLLYSSLVGGVLAIRADQFVSVNGLSNRFWGWGAEDDDFYIRLLEKRIRIIRAPPSMSRYTMLRHKQREGHARSLVTLAANRRDSAAARAQDGLRSAPACADVRMQRERLYTLLAVRPHITRPKRGRVKTWKKRMNKSLNAVMPPLK